MLDPLSLIVTVFGHLVETCNVSETELFWCFSRSQIFRIFRRIPIPAGNVCFWWLMRALKWLHYSTSWMAPNNFLNSMGTNMRQIHHAFYTPIQFLRPSWPWVSFLPGGWNLNQTEEPKGKCLEDVTTRCQLDHIFFVPGDYEPWTSATVRLASSMELSVVITSLRTLQTSPGCRWTFGLAWERLGHWLGDFCFSLCWIFHDFSNHEEW